MKNAKLITTVRNSGYMLSSMVKKQNIDGDAWLQLTAQVAIEEN